MSENLIKLQKQINNRNHPLICGWFLFDLFEISNGLLLI
jgi:hypothetical protein